MRCLVVTVAFGMVCVPTLLTVTSPYVHVHIMLVYIGIPDVEIVLVYGTPRTISQLYQVHNNNVI